MYIHDRKLSGPRDRIEERPTILRPAQRYYYPDSTQRGGESWREGLGQPVKVASDPIAQIGLTLWGKAPAGVVVAIYNPGDREQVRRAIEWAKREDGIGVRAKNIDAAELSFGKAMASSEKIVSQITKLGAALKAAVDRVPPPQGITPLAGTGPHLVRTLGLFTHGTNTGIGVGGGITTTNAAAVIKGMAPVLTDDVNIVIYGCSAARGQREKKNNWVINTMEPGGEDSLAAKIRDALVDEGKSRSSVWSHTEVGHTTRNPSLRFFLAGYGKGSKGSSYAGDFVFGTVERLVALGELEDTVRGLGFIISDEENFRKHAYKELRRLMYKGYIRAVIKIAKVGGAIVKVTHLTYRGANLPEAAPLYPLEVADIIRKHWSAVWSTERKLDTARNLIRRLTLKKA